MTVECGVAAKLAALNARFYQQQAQSFSDTRHASWAGWDRSLDVASFDEAPCSVLDVACGNMRFARYLSKRFDGARISYTGVDNCPALACAANASVLDGIPDTIACNFVERDLVSALIADEALGLCAADLVVCSGFMHHVPGDARRKRLLQELLAAVNPGGVLIVSFWRFAGVPSIAAAAAELTPCALADMGIKASQLEEGDFILGWQNKPDARRYCHSFTCDEVKKLAAKAMQEQDARFESGFIEADGRNGKLNCYLVARRLA